MELFDHQRRTLTSEWWHYIRELQKDPAYEGRKAQFLAQKKERTTDQSVPLQAEDKMQSYLLNFTKKEEEK